jgi:hypothetical protein
MLSPNTKFHQNLSNTVLLMKHMSISHDFLQEFIVEKFDFEYFRDSLHLIL